MLILLSTLPIIIFGIMVVFKVIYSQSFVLFFNWGKIQMFGLYECLDLLILAFSSYCAIRFSLELPFDYSVGDWLMVLIPVAILYRCFYLGTSRLVLKQESIIDGVSAHSFFK